MAAYARPNLFQGVKEFCPKKHGRFFFNHNWSGAEFERNISTISSFSFLNSILGYAETEYTELCKCEESEIFDDTTLGYQNVSAGQLQTAYSRMVAATYLILNDRRTKDPLTVAQKRIKKRLADLSETARKGKKPLARPLTPNKEQGFFLSEAEMKEGFSTPKKICRAPTPTEIAPIILENSFGNLEMETDVPETPSCHNHLQPDAQERKASPITLEVKGDLDATIKELSKINGRDLTVRYFNGRITFKPSSIAAFDQIKKRLVEKKEKFFYSTPKSRRPRKLVLKGLPVGKTAEEAAYLLQEAGFVPEAISPLFKIKEGKKTNPFIISMAAGAKNMPELLKIKTLAFYQVKVENLRKRKGRILICYRCQEIGSHHSTNCNMTEACLKCGGEHRYSSCPVSRDAPNLCARCNGPHRASELVCPLLQKVLKPSQEKAAPTKTRTKQPTKRQQGSLAMMTATAAFLQLKFP